MLASLLHRRAFTPSRGLALGTALLALTAPLSAVQAAPYSQLIVFGDSLSDDGNDTHITNDQFDVKYPGTDFNYSNGRFTDDLSGTSPASTSFEGVWHEQLTRRFLGLTRASDSLDGGTDYAYGDATTEDGTTTIDVVSIPVVGDVTVTIENMGQQVTDYLTAVNGVADGNALFSVWGGPTTCSTMTAPPTSRRQPTASAHSLPGWPRPVPAASSCPTSRRWATPLSTTAATRLRCGPQRRFRQLRQPAEHRARFHHFRAERARDHRHDRPPRRLHVLHAGPSAQPAAYGFTNVTDSAQGASRAGGQLSLLGRRPSDDLGHSQVAQLAADLLSGGHPPSSAARTNCRATTSTRRFPAARRSLL